MSYTPVNWSSQQKIIPTNIPPTVNIIPIIPIWLLEWNHHQSFTLDSLDRFVDSQHVPMLFQKQWHIVNEKYRQQNYWQLNYELWSIADNGTIMGWTYHLPTIIFPKNAPSYSQKFPERDLLSVQFSHDLNDILRGCTALPQRPGLKVSHNIPYFSHILPIHIHLQPRDVSLHRTGRLSQCPNFFCQTQPAKAKCFRPRFSWANLAVMARNSSYKSVRSCG